MKNTRYVTIEDMLLARDERAARQERMREQHHVPIVSFTMNIPGSIKYNALIRKAFQAGKERALIVFEKLHAEILETIEKEDFTGCECMWAVHADAKILKKILCHVEEKDGLGRLFDMDVIDAQGNHLSRNIERACLICQKPVRACARSRAHSAEELFAKTQEIICSYFQKEFVRKAGEVAQRALLYEAITTPKPGLVDCENNGAHHDMSLFHFMESASLLRAYFEDCTVLGIRNSGYDALQLSGIGAEKKMFQQLGVNTHKGAVFALGILCYAWGYCGEDADIGSILDSASSIGEYYLQQMKETAAFKTGGEMQFMQYGITGARGEAASGFATVKNISLPAFESALRAGKPLNDAGLCAMIALMANVQDSNVIRRGGIEAQKWMNELCSSVMDTMCDSGTLRELDRQFIERNISPGGCADLLAVTYFLHFIDIEKKSK